LATELDAFGFKTEVFVGASTSWSSVCQEGARCDLLVYLGHGARMSSENKTGILFGGVFLVPKDIANGLMLRSGALSVFLGACYTTGTLPQDADLVSEDTALARIARMADGLNTQGVGYLAVLADDELYKLLQNAPDRLNGPWILKGNATRGVTYIGAFVAPQGWAPNFASRSK
jgi:hypothetical protein